MANPAAEEVSVPLLIEEMRSFCQSEAGGFELSHEELKALLDFIDAEPA